MSRATKSDTDGILPGVVGTALWVLALVVLVASSGRLEEAGVSWWIGVAVCGLVSGLGGLAFLTWRKRRASQT
jgi:hypothetical protein